MDRRSVLLIGPFQPQGDGWRHRELAARLMVAGWNVVVASSRRNRLARVCDMMYTAWCSRREYTVAVITVYSGMAFVWAEVTSAMLHRLRKPFVLNLQGGNLPKYSLRHGQRVRRLFESAATVTAPSRYLQEHCRVFRDDILLLPNPLDLSVYPFRHRPHPQPDLVWLRAFYGAYNPLLGPRVIALLCEEFPTVHLTMIGPDKGDGSFQGVQKLTEQLGVSERVALPGAVAKADVPAWLHRGDIFLNTTNVDNTPTSVLEAMASGLCVVSTAVGGIPYLLDHEEDALLVPPDNPEVMAAAIRRVLTVPGLADRLSRNARAKAEQYDWSRVLPQWEELLTTVAERR